MAAVHVRSRADIPRARDGEFRTRRLQPPRGDRSLGRSDGPNTSANPHAHPYAHTCADGDTSADSHACAYGDTSTDSHSDTYPSPVAHARTDVHLRLVRVTNRIRLRNRYHRKPLESSGRAQQDDFGE